MSDIYSKLQQKINAKMTKRVAETRSGRFDFYLSDWEVSGDHEARILIGYNKDLGVPKLAQVDEWVVQSFSGQLRLALESLRNYSKIGAMSGIVVKTAHTLPYNYTKKMIPVAASADGGERFQDEDARVWEAREADSGERFLVRISKDDIASILSERQRRVRGASLAHKRPRLHQITGGISNPEIGDHVVFVDRGIKQFGEVTHVGEKMLHVSSNGEDLLVSRGSVIAVQAKSVEADSMQKQHLVDFFTKAYGDKAFATKFVTLKGNETGSDDGGVGDF